MLTITLHLNEHVGLVLENKKSGAKKAKMEKGLWTEREHKNIPNEGVHLNFLFELNFFIADVFISAQS